MEEERYLNLVARFLAARGDFLNAQHECAHLHKVIRAKQEVIEEILPYYPHPISRVMQLKIELR